MIFNSLTFLVFFAIVMALHYAPFFSWHQSSPDGAFSARCKTGERTVLNARRSDRFRAMSGTNEERAPLHQRGARAIHIPG